MFGKTVTSEYNPPGASREICSSQCKQSQPHGPTPMKGRRLLFGENSHTLVFAGKGCERGMVNSTPEHPGLCQRTIHCQNTMWNARGNMYRGQPLLHTLKNPGKGTREEQPHQCNKAPTPTQGRRNSKTDISHTLKHVTQQWKMEKEEGVRTEPNM